MEWVLSFDSSGHATLKVTLTMPTPRGVEPTHSIFPAIEEIEKLCERAIPELMYGRPEHMSLLPCNIKKA